MNILWVPHAPLGVGRTRTDHLIERLARRHHLGVMSFRVHPRGRSWRYLTDMIEHRSRYGGLYDEIAVWRFPKLGALNSWILNRATKRELARRKYDVLVIAPAPYLTGLLDVSALRSRVAIVCDYLDGGHWTLNRADTEFERFYVRSADAVLCVSHGLQRQALTLNPKSYYVPNGVDFARYRQFTATHTARDCKLRLGIDPDAYVVSIIGMTCSERLYFVDAVVALARKNKNIVLLLVGDSPFLPEIQRRAGEWRHAVRAVGAVPYADVLTYFMASDLGLSAVDDQPYYHFQSPLKIFEYAAMGKPVLAAPRVEEVAEMHLPNVEFCEPNAESLERHIELAMETRSPRAVPDLSAYDWDRLTAQVETILSVVAERP